MSYHVHRAISYALAPYALAYELAVELLAYVLLFPFELLEQLQWTRA